MTMIARIQAAVTELTEVELTVLVLGHLVLDRHGVGDSGQHVAVAVVRGTPAAKALAFQFCSSLIDEAGMRQQESFELRNHLQPLPVARNDVWVTPLERARAAHIERRAL